MMNQDYRNIDGVEVTGAQDDVLGAADKGIIQGDGDAPLPDDGMPNLERDFETQQALRFRGIKGDEKKKMTDEQRKNLETALTLSSMRKRVRTLDKTLGSEKGRKKLKKRNYSVEQAKKQRNALKEQISVVESAAKQYEVSEEFLDNQLDAIAKDVALTKKMQKEKNRAAYLRKTLKERLEYMPRTSKAQKDQSKAVYVLPTGMRQSKKKFTFDKPTDNLADEIVREQERMLEEFGQKDYNFMEDVAQFAVASTVSYGLGPATAAGGMKAGALIGSMFGPAGAAMGATIGGIMAGVSLGLASQKFGNYVIKQLKKKNKKEREDLEALKLLEAPNGERNARLALAATLGGAGQYLWNRVNPVPVNQRWRGPAHEAAIVQRLLPRDMRNLLARARVNFPQLRGEANYAGPGALPADAAMGSWQTYLHRMAYMDPQHARPILRRLAAAGNEDAMGNAIVNNLYTDWLTTHAPNLFQNVFQRALTSATLYSWYDSFNLQQPPTSMGIIGEGGRPRQTPFEGDQFRLAPRRGARRAQRLVPPAGPPAMRSIVKKEKSRSRKSRSRKTTKKERRRDTKKKPKRPKREPRKRRPQRQPVKKEGEATRRDTLLKLFKRLDKDKSGELSVKEVSRLSKRLKLTGKEIMKRMDKSGNNGVDFKEFARFMRSRAA